MARLNKTLLIGYLTADPELRQTTSGTSVCPFTIAVNRKTVKEGGPSCDFIDCVAWHGCAEFIAKYFKKGRPMLVEGEIQSNGGLGQRGELCGP